MNEIVSSDIKTLNLFSDYDFSDRSVLITGASGIIGNYIQSYFSSLPKNRAPGSISIVSMSGQFPFEISDKCKVVKIDLTKLNELERLERFDTIFHAAGYGQPGKFLSDQFKTIALNTWVTESLIEKTNRGGDFIFFSSSEIYAGNPSLRYTETESGSTNTDHPRAAYIEGKRLGETLTNLAGLQLGLNTKSLRVALVYGPGAKRDDERVLYSIIRQAIGQKEINLRDAGAAKRTYGYVLNALDQILLTAMTRENGIYNIGGVSKITILELAKLVANITESRLNVPESQDSFLKDAPSHVELDLSKTLKIGKYLPFVDIEEGLGRTISAMRKN